MFKLNLKIALRNLWKNKTYATINIFGLAAGLTGFIIILLYINFETGFDKWSPALKQTFRVGLHNIENGAETKNPEMDGFFVEMVRNKFPEVAHITMGSWPYPSKDDYLVDNQKTEQSFVYANVDDQFLDVYPIKAKYGQMKDVFSTKNAIAISLSKAKEIFGNKNPINQVITKFGGANFRDVNFVIKAVWDDQKYRSYFGVDFLSKMNFEEFGDQLLMGNYNVMLQFKKGVDVNAVINRINEEYIQKQAKRAINDSSPNTKLSLAKATSILNKNLGITDQQVIIEPVQSLNLNSYFSPNPKQKSIYILTALATFLIVISCVNFTNLAIVQATGRAKEVGVKKVLGAFRFDLTKQFVAETAMQCLIAFFIALVSAELILPLVNRILVTNLSLISNEQLPLLFVQAIGILLLIVFLSGLYPALFLSGFMPAKVLKGNFASSFGAVTLRKSLMILQFTIAGALVTSFLIMNNQLNYMRNKDLGMQADQTMVLGIQNFKNRNLNPQEFSSIKQRLSNIRGVIAISRSTDGIVGEGGFKRDFSYEGKKTQVITRYNDLNYFDILKAKIVDGRDFSEKFIATDTLNAVIINQTALKTFNLKKGVGEVVSLVGDDNMQSFNVIGVVKDIQNEGFDKAIKPTVYLASNYKWLWRKTILLNLSKENMTETIAEVKKTWRTIEPDADPIYSFADEKFAKLNASYEQMGKVMFSFSMITLLVSILGLFTLAAYSSKVRIKEIAIRKILGASTTSILKMLNADLVKLVVIANILGDLFAYIYMNKWFETFVYRIDMPISSFLWVNLGTILLTILTVSLQSLNAVKANPVNALKYE